MSIRVNIENILQSKDEIFKEILFKITSNVLRCKSEIKRKPPTKDVVLFDAIVLILQNIKMKRDMLVDYYIGYLDLNFRECSKENS